MNNSLSHFFSVGESQIFKLTEMKNGKLIADTTPLTILNILHELLGYDVISSVIAPNQYLGNLNTITWTLELKETEKEKETKLVM